MRSTRPHQNGGVPPSNRSPPPEAAQLPRRSGMPGSIYTSDSGRFFIVVQASFPCRRSPGHLGAPDPRPRRTPRSGPAPEGQDDAHPPSQGPDHPPPPNGIWPRRCVADRRITHPLTRLGLENTTAGLHLSFRLPCPFTISSNSWSCDQIETERTNPSRESQHAQHCIHPERRNPPACP